MAAHTVDSDDDNDERLSWHNEVWKVSEISLTFTFSIVVFVRVTEAWVDTPSLFMFLAS